MGGLRAYGVRGFIIVEDDLVLLKTPSTKKGEFEINSQGAELIPFSKIGGLGFKSASRIDRGFIQLGIYENGILTDFSDDAIKLEEDVRRVLYFKKSDESSFILVRDKLKEVALQTSKQSSASEPTALSQLEQKSRLSELFNTGILTKEELDKALQDLDNK